MNATESKHDGRDESTQNDETSQIGRVCDSCGGFYMAVAVRGPEFADARRGCGCPVTVVPSNEDLRDDESEDGEVVSE